MWWNFIHTYNFPLNIKNSSLADFTGFEWKFTYVLISFHTLYLYCIRNNYFEILLQFHIFDTQKHIQNMVICVHIIIGQT